MRFRVRRRRRKAEVLADNIPRVREVVIAPTLEAFRDAARRLIAEGVPPGEVLWRAREGPEARSLFDAPETEAPPPPGPELMVPRPFVALASAVVPRRDPDRWRLLYSVLWRIAGGDRDLMLRRDDPDLQQLRRLADAPAERAAGPGAAAGDGDESEHGAAPFVPTTSDLGELARAAASCRGCDLYRDATQTVFGKGPSGARAVLVGEQPGDQEDLQGAPFVGPAGAVLDRALAEAGLARAEVYVTNAVKHFKFVRTPKRRLHQTPNSAEIGACRPWLLAELSILEPRVLVCLGASASKALLGDSFRITRDRGRFLESSYAPRVMATYHPSAVLRAEDPAGEKRIYDMLVSDLRLAKTAIA
jgi:uracil-DNA glycosylase